MKIIFGFKLVSNVEIKLVVKLLMRKDLEHIKVSKCTSEIRLISISVRCFLLFLLFPLVFNFRLVLN